MRSGQDFYLDLHGHDAWKMFQIIFSLMMRWWWWIPFLKNHQKNKSKWITLPKTHSSHLKIGQLAPKRKRVSYSTHPFSGAKMWVSGKLSGPGSSSFNFSWVTCFHPRKITPFRAGPKRDLFPKKMRFSSPKSWTEWVFSSPESMGPRWRFWKFSHPLRIQICPEKGITPIFLLWGWDWDHQTYSNREGYGSL